MMPFHFLQDLLTEEAIRFSEVRECSEMVMTDLQLTRKLPDTLRAFGQLKTNPQKINFTQKLLKKYNLARFYENPNKNEQESNKLREMGNIIFKENHIFSASKTSLYEQAAREYTQSIAYAPKDSQCLAMGYANRSAALFHLKLYKECVEDIDRAYERYPLVLRSKIVNRRKEALSLMNKRLVLQFHTPTPEILQINKNESIDCASNAIKIQKTADACQIIATRDIKAGELLVAEKAFLCNAASKIRNPASFALQCSICLNLCYNLIPCDDCNQELFCSESCKSRSKDLPYKYLCGMRSTLDCAQDHSIQLALLLALKIVCDQSPNNGSDANGSKKNLECYLSDRLDEVLNLPTGEGKMSLKYQFVLALEAGTVFQLLLTYSSAFQQSNINRAVFKDQLLRSFYICSQHFRPVNKAVQVVTPKYMNVENIGSAIYSFSSLFRRSCIPNTHAVTFGTTKAIFATEKIKKNDEICTLHGNNITATKVPPLKRKVYLEMTRGYPCNCVACVEEWPTDPIFFPIDHKMSPSSLLISSELNHQMAEMLREHTLGNPIGRFVIGNGFSFDRFKTLLEKAMLVANETVKKPSVEYFDIHYCTFFLFLLMGNTHFKLLN